MPHSAPYPRATHTLTSVCVPGSFPRSPEAWEAEGYAAGYDTRRRDYPATHSGSTLSGGYRTNNSCGRYCALYAMDGQPAIQYPR
jgi:hypothetical protein